MTKRDYELIAETIARAYIHLYNQGKNPAIAISAVVDSFMITLTAENPRFLPGKFRQYVEKLIGEASCISYPKNRTL